MNQKIQNRAQRRRANRHHVKRATAFALAGLMATSGISLPAGTFAYGAENNTLLAFAGAEGGGRFATGGRGYDVYVVTTLEDYGKGETPVEGSLRYGIEEFAKDKGGTMIVFNVGGTIELKQTLTFKERKNITVAGQTAPGDGITLSGWDTNISNSENLIIRYMRFRPGAANVHTGGDSMDALWGRDNKTFMIDHCSFSWNTDETVSTYRGQDGTVQWCIVSESLTVSGHSKGRHGYGGIFGGDNVLFQNNLIANHTSRNPRIGGGCMGDPTKDGGSTATLQLSNNVLYNWGYNTCYGGGYAYTNFINNFLKPGQGTREQVRYQVIDMGEANLNLSGTAQHFQVSEGYLSSIFKEYAGICFAEYLEKCRIEKSCVLLSDTDSTIEQIAEDVGYNSVYSYRRAFKRLFHISPSAYREQKLP
jgi:AraC-like DNA-binding protein